VTSIGVGMETSLFFFSGNSSVSFFNSRFYTFNSNGVNHCGIFFARAQNNVNCTFESCEFDNVTDNRDNPILFGQNYDYTANCTVRFNNNVVKNILATASNTSQAATFYLKNIKWVGYNNTYFNVSSPNNNGFRGAVYGLDNLGFTNLTLTNDSFNTIVNRGNGGAINSNCPRNFTLSGCVFELCSSTNGRGGAIFIDNIGIFSFAYCSFSNNTAAVANGGNDIGHNQNLYNAYSSSNFVVTCSNSDNNKISFPDGQNLNNLLLGMCVIVIVYFPSFFFFSFIVL
jgi:hypothetical protein